MELVTAVDLSSTSATAYDQTSKRLTLPLSSLLAQGLPSNATSPQRLTIDLTSLEPAKFEEYAFGNGLPDAAGGLHATWSFRAERERYVVPALVLMRALIGNFPKTFVRAFAPQSLDDLCCADTHDGVPSVHLSELALRRKGDEVEELRRRLTWFFCFASARATWSSVYNSALSGSFGLEIPAASITGWFHGRRSRSNVYVTKLQIESLEAHEQPLEFAIGCPQQFRFVPESRRIVRGTRARPVWDIPLRNGEFALDDQEWMAVSQLLDRDYSHYHNTRTTVDDVLRKWSQDLPWLAVTNSAGEVNTAACSAYYRWRQDGRFLKLLALLKGMRQA